MSTTLPLPPTEDEPNYLNVDYGWKSWLFTTDHKRIALLYLFSITAFFFVGGVFAVVMRLNLLTPEGLFEHDTYNKLFTMHGIIMVFFFLVPSIPATLGNFLIPMMIGARDLAFPRINLLSWYIYIVGGIVALTAIVRGRRRHRMDVLRALQRHLFEYSRDSGGAGNFHLRLLVDSDWPEFHRHHPQNARSGHDLGSPAAVRVGALRHQPDPGAGNAGDRDYHGAAGPGALASRRDFRSRGWAATRSCSSTCSGSIRIPPFTS